MINFDASGFITLDNNGVAVYVWETNKDGWIISEKYMDANYKPIWNGKGYYEERINWNQDSENYIIRFEFYDEKGYLTKNKNGFSITTVRFDKKTESTQEIKYSDKNNRLTLCNKGYSILKFQYDEQCNRINQSYFDTQNNVCNNKDGISIYEWSFDRLGNLMKLSSYDIKKNLVAMDKAGIAMVINKYDSVGNLTEKRFFDKKENSKENKKHEAIIRWLYDEKGVLISIKGYDSKDRWVSERYSRAANNN